MVSLGEGFRLIEKEFNMSKQSDLPVISLMLAVTDGPAAVEWYKRALGATVLGALAPWQDWKLRERRFSLGNPRTTAGRVR